MSKIKVEDEHRHDGHRQRLLKQILDVGIDRVSDVVALEFILTYVIPRTDTKKIAYDLLDEFGSVANVLDCDPYTLTKVNGLSTTSANRLHLLVDIFNYYADKRMEKHYRFERKSDIADYFEELLRFKNVEMSYVVAVGANFEFLAKKQMSSGSVRGVTIDSHMIAQFIINTKPAFLLIAHNHPHGEAKPSQADILGTEMVKTLCSSMSVRLLDHIIVGYDGVYSIVNNELVMRFA